ncbi:hypothetical protein B296_00041624 [Ensete ventricosum]|uniref:Uncharacterized protein n=1 Tax=Ensete ventricosum TaxID=4639 RepID=A0A426XGT1_ENSVE|nr:hypothetical protein B296_00041624 [Ensete ventricosum]
MHRNLPPRHRGVAAPAGSRAGRGQQPLAGALQPAPFASAVLQVAMPVGGCRPCRLAATNHARGQRFCSQAPPLQVATAPCGHHWPPFRAGPTAANHPFAGGLGRGLAMGGRPSQGLAVAGRPSSSLPSLRKCSKNA